MIEPKGYKGSAIDLATGDFCGLEGDWKSKLIPQKYFFSIDLTEACKIHDYMYTLGLTDKAKVEADLYFLCNLLVVLLKLDPDRLKVYCDMLLDRLEHAYTTQLTNSYWKVFWNSIDQEVKSSKVNFFGKWIRYSWSKSFYEAVDLFGYEAYWKNKPDKNTLTGIGQIQ